MSGVYGGCARASVLRDVYFSYFMNGFDFLVLARSGVYLYGGHVILYKIFKPWFIVLGLIEYFMLLSMLLDW